MISQVLRMLRHPATIIITIENHFTNHEPMSAFSTRNRLRSFGYAFQGAKTVVLSQHNAWIHAAATVVVGIAGVVCHVSTHDWALLVFATAMVWMAEAMNTALEFLADAVSEEKNHRIGKAKDVAAFGVLICAIAAAIVGGIVFFPYLRIPKGFRPPAQGCEQRATLGQCR